MKAVCCIYNINISGITIAEILNKGQLSIHQLLLFRVLFQTAYVDVEIAQSDQWEST